MDSESITSITSSKSFSCSKYDKHYYHKTVHRDGLDMCHPTDLKHFNNPANNTGATVKLPWYCPIGAKCHFCRDNGKGSHKSKAKNMKIMFEDI